MDKEVKARWIEALGSGAYDQATSALSDNHGFCCLGVLCEIAIEDGILTKEKYDDRLVTYRSVEDPTDWDRSVLPGAAMAWAGIDSTNPEFVIEKEDIPDSVDINGYTMDIRGNYVTTLAGLNDNGATFQDIIKVIEKYF